MLNSKPRVSILISILNGEATLDKCLQSLFSQTYQNFKVVCLNENSSDSTGKILKKWQRFFGKDRFIILNNEKKLGVPRSSNKGLVFIDTFYIARIDHDDYWHKEKLKKQIKFLEKNRDYGLIGCNHINIYEDNAKEKKYIRLPKTDELIRKKLFRRNPFAHSCIVAKTDLIKKVGGYTETIKYGSDLNLYLKIFPYTKFYNIQEFLCYRLMLNQGISISRQNQQMWQSIKTRSKYIKKYKYSWKNYLYLLEPLAVILTPNFVKNLKRKYL